MRVIHRAALVTLLLATAVVQAQDGGAPRISIADPDLVQHYIESLKQARTALAGYRWHARTAITIDGNELIVQLLDVRLDREGRLRYTVTGHERENTTLEGPIRRYVVPLETGGDGADEPANPVSADDSVAPADEQAAALKRLAESYTHPEPGNVRRVPLVPAPLTSLQPLSPTSAPTAGDASAPPETRFRLYDMIRRGDTFEVWLDDELLVPLRLAAETDFDGAPFAVSAEYSRLPDGTVYTARSIVRTVVEERTIEVRSEAFGFEKRRSAN